MESSPISTHFSPLCRLLILLLYPSNYLQTFLMALWSEKRFQIYITQVDWKSDLFVDKQGVWQPVIQKRRIQSHQNKKLVRQFMSSFQAARELDEVDGLWAKVVEDIITHLIHVHFGGNDVDIQDMDNENERKVFNHMTRLEGNETQTVFNAQLQNVAISYAAIATITELRFGTLYDGISIVADAAKGSSTGWFNFRCTANLSERNS